jgi:hypothetical protein
LLALDFTGKHTDEPRSGSKSLTTVYQAVFISICYTSKHFYYNIYFQLKKKDLNLYNFVFLAELRSLSVPGTYQEKITHLGNSLMRLTGLKSLDLSRNSLVSLEVSFRFVCLLKENV